MQSIKKYQNIESEQKQNQTFFVKSTSSNTEHKAKSNPECLSDTSKTNVNNQESFFQDFEFSEE